jgi:hypothetical protein
MFPSLEKRGRGDLIYPPPPDQTLTLSQELPNEKLPPFLMFFSQVEMNKFVEDGTLLHLEPPG